MIFVQTNAVVSQPSFHSSFFNVNMWKRKTVAKESHISLIHKTKKKTSSLFEFHLKNKKVDWVGISNEKLKKSSTSNYHFCLDYFVWQHKTCKLYHLRKRNWKLKNIVNKFRFYKILVQQISYGFSFLKSSFPNFFVEITLLHDVNGYMFYLFKNYNCRSNDKNGGQTFISYI